MSALIHALLVRYGLSILCLSTLVLASGCAKTTAKVSGKVLLDDRPLKGGGTVTFEGDKGGVSGQVTPEGTYTIPNAPVGKVRITLASGMSNTSAGAGANLNPDGQPPNKVRKLVNPARPLNNIPEKYTDPRAGALTYTVKEGEQTFDILLSSK